MPIVRLIPMKVVAKRISIWKYYWADINYKGDDNDYNDDDDNEDAKQILPVLLSVIPTIFLAINM